MKTLVFAPHPDDEIIGCGGYLAKLITTNNLVDIAYLTVPSEIRRAEIERVKKYIRFSTIYLLGETERSIALNEPVLRKILHLIRHSKPDQLIFPHKNENDMDHRSLAEILLDCIRFVPTNFLLEPNDEPHSIDSVLGYEVWTPIQSPQLYIDITNFIKTKRQSMALYKSQLEQNDFITMFDGLNKFRSITSGGSGYAEAFEIYSIGEKKFNGGGND